MVVSGRVWIFILHQRSDTNTAGELLTGGRGGVTASPAKQHAFRLYLNTVKNTQKPAAGEKNCTFLAKGLSHTPPPPLGWGVGQNYFYLRP